MLTEPLIQQLTELRLRGMAAALEHQCASPDVARQTFDNRLGLMIQQEIIERGNARLAQRLRWPKLPIQACLEDLDRRTARGIDPGQLGQLTDLGWLREHLNLLITGSGRGSSPPGRADQISFKRPDGLAVDEDGSVYVADGFGHAVYRVSRAGTVTIVAGTGDPGYSGDGGKAVRARLSRPADIRIGRDGELFIADVQNHSVRHVDASGRITTIVGTGQPGFSPDGTLASEASLNTQLPRSRPFFFRSSRE